MATRSARFRGVAQEAPRTVPRSGTTRSYGAEPEALRPGLTTETITRHAAEEFAQLADALRIRGIPAEAAAHFLMKLIFCMSGEDIRLLPEKLFERVLRGCRSCVTIG